MRQDDVYSMMNHQDLPEQFRIVSEVCGIETAKILIKGLGGISVSIPKLTSLRPLLERYIKENIDDVPVKKIAMTLGMNERAIGNIVKKMGEK